MNAQPHLEVAIKHGVTLLRFLDRHMIDGIHLNALWQEVSQLIDSTDRKQFVLSLSLVDALSGTALGKLIAVHKKVRGLNGRLKLCCVCPEVLKVFSITKLDALFRIEDTEASAIAAFA